MFLLGVGVILLGGQYLIKCHGKLNNTILQVYIYHTFSFSFLYFSSIANVTAFSLLQIKDTDKHNYQQFNVKTILKKKTHTYFNPC